MLSFSKRICFVLIFVALVLTSCKANQPDENAIADDVCIPPLETFAYPVKPGSNSPVPTPEMLLSPLWKIVETPFFAEGDWIARDVLASRTYNGQREVWLKNDRQITIYYPDSKTWKNVPAVIGDSQIYLDKLFVTQDNALLGLPNWHYSGETTKFLLSKYNEATERFEYAPGTQEIQVSASRGPFPYFVVLDAEKNIFWVLVTDDGIYSYNPQTQVSQKHLTLPDLDEYIVLDVAYSPDGNLYYFAGPPAGPMTYQDSRLYRFEISTKELSSTLILLEPSLTSHSIFADHSGRVWFGALGWMEADGYTWYQLVRSLLFIDNIAFSGLDYSWKSPDILMESSDKRLWFRSSGNGMFWLDPAKGKWCWVAVYHTDHIIEDQEQNMWAVLGGKLYRYPLNP